MGFTDVMYEWDNHSSIKGPFSGKHVHAMLLIDVFKPLIMVDTSILSLNFKKYMYIAQVCFYCYMKYIIEVWIQSFQVNFDKIRLLSP